MNRSYPILSSVKISLTTRHHGKFSSEKLTNWYNRTQPSTFCYLLFLSPTRRRLFDQRTPAFQHDWPKLIPIRSPPGGTKVTIFNRLYSRLLRFAPSSDPVNLPDHYVSNGEKTHKRIEQSMEPILSCLNLILTETIRSVLFNFLCPFSFGQLSIRDLWKIINESDTTG